MQAQVRAMTLNLIFMAAASPTEAQNTLTPLTPPEPRPYPYHILDAQPGMLPSEVQPIFEERMDLTMEPEELTMRVGSPDGRSFELAFPQNYVTKGIGVYAHMGDDPMKEMRMTLATDVLENRVVSIRRLIRAPIDDLPDPAALQAQIEDLYGPPSELTPSTSGIEMLYAWGEAGFISEIYDAPEETVEHSPGDGSTETITFRPCFDVQSGATYDFEQFRKRPIAPGCTAVFRVSYSADSADTATLTFNLIDYDLLRQSTLETDRQIMNAITTEAEVEPSDFDL